MPRCVVRQIDRGAKRSYSQGEDLYKHTGVYIGMGGLHNVEVLMMLERLEEGNVLCFGGASAHQ